MNRWLKKISESTSHPTDKTDLYESVSFVSASTCAFEKKNDPATVPEWLDWIAKRCPIVREDRAHIAKMLYRLHPRLQQRLTQRYLETWLAAAGAEPKSHRKENAGRRAANLVVTRLLAGQEDIQ